MSTATVELKTGSEVLDKNFIKDNANVETIKNFEELDVTKGNYFMFKNFLIVVDISDINRPSWMIIKESKRSRNGFKFIQNYYTRNIPYMLKRIEEFINNTISNENYKKEIKEKAKIDQANAIKNLKVGDVMVNSWGWEQTNVDFYQVTKIKGKSAWIRPIGGESVEGSEGFMSDRVKPIKDIFYGEEERKVIKAFGSSVSMSTRHGSLSNYTEGEEGTYRSWYA